MTADLGVYELWQDGVLVAIVTRAALADAKHAILAQIEAEEDARHCGIGFVKFLPDGTQERLDPATVFLAVGEGKP